MDENIQRCLDILSDTNTDQDLKNSILDLVDLIPDAPSDVRDLVENWDLADIRTLSGKIRAAAHSKNRY